MKVYTCIIAVLFCFSLHIAHTSSQQSKCPKELRNCSCSSVRLACDLKGFTIFPENISPEHAIQDLSLGQNNLTEINDNHLRFFTHLRYLNLRENEILTISENAFYNNKMIHMIDLSANRLSSLPINLFKRLKSLEDVYLGENQLKVIETVHFGGLVNLKKIRLHDNQLTKVGSDAFLDSPGMTELYLENNKLQTPERNWLLHFDHTEPSGYELYLDANPWSCDCRMKEFHDWAIRKNWFTHAPNDAEGKRRVSIPKCAEPANLRGREISELDSQSELICQGAKIMSTSDDTTVFEGDEITLQCNATGFPTPIVSLIDPKGNVLTENTGRAKFVLNAPSASDSGEYICNASGHRQSKTVVSVIAVIDINIHKHPAPVVSIVFVTLLVVAILLGMTVWYYKKYRPKSQYGRLPNDPKFDDGETASYAKNNAESMRVSLSRPSGQSPYQSAITSHVSRGAETDDDEDVTEYHKDTEYLV